MIEKNFTIDENHQSFLKKIGVEYKYVQKLMTRDFFIFFDNNAQRDLGKIKLEKNNL